MIKVFVIGSCVSRDAFSIPHAGEFEVVEYCARSSLGSAFAAIPFEGVALDKIDSPFQRRMVERDLSKKLADLIRKSDADVFVLDAIDERFGIYCAPGGALCTLSNELYSSGFVPDEDYGRVILSGCEEFFRIWERGWATLVRVLEESGRLSLLRINRVHWSSTKADGTGFDSIVRRSSIDAANQFLDRLYARMGRDLCQRQFVVCPRYLQVGAVDHRWGASPFHFIDAFYSAFISGLAESRLSPPSSAGAGIPSKTSRLAFSKSNLLSLHQFNLDSRAEWRSIEAPPGALITFEISILGRQGTTDRRALISVDFGSATVEDPGDYGLARSHDESIGLYRYLSTGPGRMESSFRFRVPAGVSVFRIKLRSWWPEAPLFVERFDVSVGSSLDRKTVISVDVEALPGRADTDHVGRLIFGRFDDSKRGYGIERLCDIFQDFGVRATFFVDYSCCALHGEDGIFHAAEVLAERGHDVQLHMHSEVLVRHLRVTHSPAIFPAFDSIDLSVVTDVLNYGVERFTRNLGRMPRIFRPGGMKYSKVMYEAVQRCGIDAVSAVFRRGDDRMWSVVGRYAAFLWENGVKELPLDFALDPLVTWPPFEREVTRVFASRNIPVASMLLHSTSLLSRKGGNGAVFEGHSEPYEKQLIEYLEVLASIGGFATYSELLDSESTVPTFPLNLLEAGSADGQVPVGRSVEAGVN